MKTLLIGGSEYKLEYTFGASEHKDTVQKMFKVLSGAYLMRKGVVIDEKDEEKAKEAMVNAMIDGSAEMVADVPHIVKSAFYAGLLEHNPKSEEEAYSLMKEYMKENKISYRKLFEDIRECMEDDGFFDLSGLTEMLQEMNKAEEKKEKKSPKVPQDHKKSTSTK